jgi:hypothetical protein
MTKHQAKRILNRIRICGPSGSHVEPGLSEAELTAIEAEFAFEFPPDLRLVLSLGLPNGGNFPPWRDKSQREELRGRLSWPLESMQFDIENNAFWYPAWGARPASIEEAKAIVAREVATVQRLIPVYSHRYLPAEPCEAGNPVLSVYQTDIIYYGADLTDYVKCEFGWLRSVGSREPTRRIRF